jgi:hypothetical protein
LFYETPVPENYANITFTIFSSIVIVNGDTFVPESPREVLGGVLAFNVPHAGGEFPTYAITPDGQRFLWFQRVLSTGAATTAAFIPDPPNNLTVALYWASSLKAK